jgi:riboflavin kinase/FMN adenylyltransferase
VKTPVVPLPDLLPDADVRHVAVGVFDGVHRGHAAVIQTLKKEAGTEPTAVLTFAPHPLRIIAPEKAPGLLTSLEERCALLQEFGIGRLIVLRFDSSLRELQAEVFVEKLRQAFPRLRSVTVGANFHFGNNREGNGPFLQTLGERHGFQVHIVEARCLDGNVISSSRIRQAVLRRDFAEAEALLGRPYAFSGEVVRGDGRGRELGFPTANLDIGERLLPPSGVYAGFAQTGGQSHRAVLNIGFRPTLTDSRQITVEIHLLDFTGDLYGQTVAAGRLHFLREEKKFRNAEELKQQLEADIKTARRNPADSF